MRMRKMKRKKYGNAEERAELLVRVGCLLFLLVMTRICVAAGEPLPDAEQISLLKQAGCKVGQGYFLSKPIDAEVYRKLS